MVVVYGQRVHGGQSDTGLFFIWMMTLASVLSDIEPQEGFLSEGIM